MQLNTVSSLLPPGQLFPVASVQRPVSPVTTPPAIDTPKTPESTEPISPSIFGSDTFSTFSQYAGQSASGAFAAFQLGERTSHFYREISKAFEGGAAAGNGWTQARPGIEGAVMSGVHGAGIGALVSAGVAVASYGYQAMQGDISVEELTDHVLTDSLSGAFAGFGGATLGGAGHLIMSSMGMAGLPLKIGTAIAGAIGGVLLAQMSQPMEDTPSQQKKKTEQTAA